MKERELLMYKLQDIVEALLKGTGVKKISRTVKVSKNTVKKYREIVIGIREQKPEKRDDIIYIMEEFRRLRKEERYSENFGWLEVNRKELEALINESDNYIRIIELIKEKGFKGSYSSLLRYIHKNNINMEKPVIRIETNPGEVAQVDFGSIGKIYDEETKIEVKAYIFVMVLCYSREGYYEIVKSQDIRTWCRCHIHAFEHFGGVVKIIIPDNLKSAIVKASFMKPEANKSYRGLALHYGFQIDPCVPGTPEHKGKVESGVKYVKNNFIPFRRFDNFFDANKQLTEWNENVARTRIHGTTRRRPIDLFHEYEKHCLNPLPIERFEIPIWKNPIVYRDIHIQFDKAYYSVPHDLRGKRVWARKTDTQVAIFHENKIVAVHSPALAGVRRTNKDHYPPSKYYYMKYDSEYCLKKAKLMGEHVFKMIKILLENDPIRNLRAAQHILWMNKKYSEQRLDAACKRALYFDNCSYYSIKEILEKNLDKQLSLFEEESAEQLDATYAIDIKQFLLEEAQYGNIITG